MRLLGCGVGCVRGGREVFSGLDFEASSGEVLAVTGPNGATYNSERSAGGGVATHTWSGTTANGRTFGGERTWHR